MKRILLRGAGLSIVVIVALYAIATGYLYIHQRDMVYHPFATYTPPAEANGGLGMVELPVTTEDGLALTGWYRPASSKPLTILFFHGNGAGIAAFASVAKPYVDAGYGFLLAEYRGYSGMPGTPTEAGLYTDGRAFLHKLEGLGIADDHIVLFGHSLGTGVATEMAAETKTAGLMLLAPFLSLVRVAQERFPIMPVTLLSTERFESFRKIGGIHCPVLIGHGLRDEVIPVADGKALFALASEPKALRLFAADGHSDAFDDFSVPALDWLSGLTP